MALLASLCLGFIPMLGFALYVNWLDRYEKEPLWLLAATFLWGAILASALAFIINTTLGMGIYLATASPTLTEWTTSILFAPVIEETLKGAALLLIFLLFRPELDSPLDGVIYAGMVGLGFGATENFYYIYAHGYQESGWEGLIAVAFIRIVLVGWQHAFYTAFTGLGFSLARLQRSGGLRLALTLAGMGAAIFTHALHNTLASLPLENFALFITVALDWSGWLGMLILILVLIHQEKRLLERHLGEEVALGVLTQQQYAIAASALAQSAARTRAFFRGNLRATARFYQLCGELAHKKEQLRRLGEERNNSEIIAALRAELRQLAEKI